MPTQAWDSFSYHVSLPRGCPSFNTWGQGSRSKDREEGSMAMANPRCDACLQYGCMVWLPARAWYGMSRILRWLEETASLRENFVRENCGVNGRFFCDSWCCQSKFVELFGINSVTLLSFSFWALNSSHSSPSQLSQQICRFIGPYVHPSPMIMLATDWFDVTNNVKILQSIDLWWSD